jgi:hypothetical protein
MKTYTNGILGFNPNGWVPGDGDTVPAKLTPGEYVVSRQTAIRLGLSALSSLAILRKQRKCRNMIRRLRGINNKVHIFDTPNKLFKMQITTHGNITNRFIVNGK